MTIDLSKATEEQGIEILYRGRSIETVPFQDATQYNQHCYELDLDPLITDPVWSKQFNVPLYYQQLDVEQYVRNLIPPNSDSIKYERVEQELEQFASRNLYPVLQLLIYIVDTMRKHNLVWGVGRGSSVASYVLYLIGVHRIDSVKYNLDIQEFLK
jgi:DNA polymerase III alpha subunit